MCRSVWRYPIYLYSSATSLLPFSWRSRISSRCRVEHVSYVPFQLSRLRVVSLSSSPWPVFPSWECSPWQTAIASRFLHHKQNPRHTLSTTLPSLALMTRESTFKSVISLLLFYLITLSLSSLGKWHSLAVQQHPPLASPHAVLLTMHFFAFPGDSSSEEYDGTLPDFLHPIVFGVGHVSNVGRSTESPRSFTISTSSYISGTSIPSSITYDFHFL